MRRMRPACVRRRPCYFASILHEGIYKSNPLSGCTRHDGDYCLIQLAIMPVRTLSNVQTPDSRVAHSLL